MERYFRTWDTVASGRGLTEGELVLSGELEADHLGDGATAVLVTGEDPFADDLPNEIAAALEDPDDYDFAIAHVTDTQYLTEGAAEDAYSEEQQAVWADAYTDTLDWIVENADERKIEYVAHTGDIMENWHTASERDDEQEYRQIAIEEFEFASEAQRTPSATRPSKTPPGGKKPRPPIRRGVQMITKTTTTCSPRAVWTLSPST